MLEHGLNNGAETKKTPDGVFFMEVVADLAGSFGLRAGFANRELAAFHLGAVGLGDGGVGLSVVGHLDKAKALRATGCAVHNNGGIKHLTVLGEKFA